MFGFFVGTVCLIGLVGMVRGPRCHRGFDGPHSHHRRHRRRRGGRRGSFERAAGEMFKRKLDIDEDQEDIVDLAFADLKTTASELSAAMKESRGDLADAFRGGSVDEGALDAAFARQDEAISRARRQAVSALKQIHAVLDDDQRDTATDWLGAGKGWV